MNAVEVKNIWKHYPAPYTRKTSLSRIFSSLLRKDKRPERFTALKNINLKIKKGETVGVIGRNASGKTTLLRLICGITYPNEGSIRILGKVASLLELGAGFQPDLTGKENIYLNGLLLGLTKKDIERSLDSIIEFADIGDFINAPMQAYSAGMYLRLGFAIAVHAQADIMLIDEVLTVGDIGFQERCRNKIEEFKKIGTTIIFVSQDLRLINELCDKVILLDNGEVLMQGYEKSVVINRYLTLIDGEKQKNGKLHIDKARIKNVYFKNEKGEHTSIFETRERVCICIEYIAHQKIFMPVFGIGIYYEDIYLVGPNTRDQSFKIDYIEGEGIIEFKTHIPFASGRYKVSTSLHNLEETVFYDYHDKLFELIVKKGPTDIKYGLLDIKGEWSIA